MFYERDDKMISIIIPIYNSEKYLKECLTSIQQQSYKDFEAILINDGSSDGSVEICENFCKKDDRFRLLSQQNQGVSKARNKGISVSKGEYIMFVDSDDYLEFDALKIIDSNIKNNDLLCFGYSLLFKNKKTQVLLENSSNNFNDICKNILLDNYLGGYLWNKVFKRAILKNNNISFRENVHFCEDLLFVNDYLKYCHNIYYFNLSLYNYRMRKSSVSYNFYNKKNISILDSYETLAKMYKAIDEVYNKFCWEYIINYYKLKKIVQQTNKKIDDSILKEEKNLVKNQNTLKQISFYFLKYFPNAYMRIRNFRNKMKKLFD